MNICWKIYVLILTVSSYIAPYIVADKHRAFYIEIVITPVIGPVVSNQT